MSFVSLVEHVGSMPLPPFTGVRAMMLPFRLEDPFGTIPKSLVGPDWQLAAAVLCEMAPAKRGVGYLTIDEAVVPKGETHRRPGLHVDGVDEEGRIGGWGGGGGYAGQDGMLLVSSAVGCRAWDREFRGDPGPDGDCDHLWAECISVDPIVMQPNQVYLCGPLTVHEAIPMPCKTRRSFCRLSMPSSAPWYDGYTRNPLGVEPTGPIRPRRPGMDYRS
jgi:hypothetical protein